MAGVVPGLSGGMHGRRSRSPRLGPGGRRRGGLLLQMRATSKGLSEIDDQEPPSPGCSRSLGRQRRSRRRRERRWHIVGDEVLEKLCTAEQPLLTIVEETDGGPGEGERRRERYEVGSRVHDGQGIPRVKLGQASRRVEGVPRAADWAHDRMDAGGRLAEAVYRQELVILRADALRQIDAGIENGVCRFARALGSHHARKEQLSVSGHRSTRLQEDPWAW